jgi:hypothetical protein
MCGVFPNKYALKRHKIKNPKDLLTTYIKRQAWNWRGDYVCFCINNPRQAMKVATEVYNYRTDNWDELIDWDFIDIF